MIVDAHQHFWRYEPAEYGWIGDDCRALRRDFLPADLQPEIRAAGVDGVVAVQARQTVAETEWLLELARQHAFIRGVVGWLPLSSPTLRADLERATADPKLKGLRHVIQDEPDDGYILGSDFNRGVRALREFGLVYDLLILARQLPATIAFVDRHPGQIFVLNHIAKPLIKADQFEPWNTNVRELARRPNVFCKVSGLVTEGEFQSWTADQLRRYYDVVLEAFGPRRLMFGSDWPVCTVACDYGRWYRTVAGWTETLAPAERVSIRGGTAQEVYRL